MRELLVFQMRWWKAQLLNMGLISAIGAMSVCSGVNWSLAARIECECITNICFMLGSL